MRSRLLAGAGAVVASLLFAQSAFAEVGDKAVAELKNEAGDSLGTVELEHTVQGTLLHARLKGLPEGTHAFHLHETGKCVPTFKSAGGHFNPRKDEHGYRAAAGPHAGDFPNIHVPASGKLEFEYFTRRILVGDAMFDKDGTAIVIHMGADDYKSQPSGAAGDRIACGVIEQVKE